MKEFVLIENGHSCNVCIAASAPESAKTASGELCRCLSGMGADVPEVRIGTPHEGEICIGAADDCACEELRIQVRDGILWLDGGKRGVLYSAYELLERLGCRFLAADCEVLPPLPADGRLTLPGDTYISQTPVFEYREAYWKGVTPEFAPRLRLNGVLGMGIKPEYGGDIHYAGFVHTLGDLSEMEQPYTDRQPCLSDENVFQTVVRNLRRRLDEDPTATIASVSQNDSHEWGRGCQCAACRAKDEAEGTPMGSLLQFVNHVAEDIAPDYPDVAIDTLAYRYTRRAPATLQANDNVIVRLCSIECCFSHPIESCDSTVYSVEDGSFADTLRKWGQHCRRVYIWDYTTNFRNYNVGFPNFGVLRQNLRFFAQNNVRGVYEQGNRQSVNGEFDDLRSYLLGKLLWDPYMDEQTYMRHMDDFLSGYYGPGAPAIRRYLDRMQRGAADSHFGIYFEDPTQVYVDPDTDGDTVCRAEAFLRKGRADFAEALAAAKTDAQAAHIRRSAVQLDVYCWYCRRLELQALSPDDPDFPAAEDALRAAGKQLLTSARAAGITRMHESGSQDADFTVTEQDMLTQPAFWGV